MPKSLLAGAASGVVAIAVTVWLWYTPESSRSTAPEARSTDVGTAGSGGGAVKNGSPFAVEPAASTSQIIKARPVTRESPAAQATDPALPLLDVTQLARAPLSDEDYESLVARLQSDPALLQQLIDEFRRRRCGHPDCQ